jgi:hypothetical protein
MQQKIQHIENEMDLRVESLVKEIHKYRLDFRLKLKEYKQDFEELHYIYRWKKTN